jgi:hypothetical protein
MTRARHYSTREAMQALGVSRSTLYNWKAEADCQGPGKSDSLWWTQDTIRRLAKAHGRTLDESVFDVG